MLAFVGVLLGQPDVGADHGYRCEITQGTAPSGGGELVCPHGAVRVRDIQMGDDTGRPWDLNGDIAAGNAVNRGNINVNWDLGKCFNVFNGYKKKLLAVCGPNEHHKRGVIKAYVPIKRMWKR
jgi:hypothetical protein